jgi:hypothetical protein
MASIRRFALDTIDFQKEIDSHLRLLVQNTGSNSDCSWSFGLVTPNCPNYLAPSLR